MTQANLIVTLLCFLALVAVTVGSRRLERELKNFRLKRDRKASPAAARMLAGGKRSKMNQADWTRVLTELNDAGFTLAEAEILIAKFYDRLDVALVPRWPDDYRLKEVIPADPEHGRPHEQKVYTTEPPDFLTCSICGCCSVLVECLGGCRPFTPHPGAKNPMLPPNRESTKGGAR